MMVQNGELLFIDMADLTYGHPELKTSFPDKTDAEPSVSESYRARPGWRECQR